MTEQQVYSVTATLDGVEERAYEDCVIATVEVDGSFESAGNKGFRPLIGFISGGNETKAKVAMTSPVIQDVPGGRSDQNGYAISFVMPAGATREELPVPADARVVLQDVPAHTALAVRYSGRWTRTSFDKHVGELRSAAAAHGYRLVGDPRYARYDPPWTPWFRRRTEVIWTVETD